MRAQGVRTARGAGLYSPNAESQWYYRDDDGHLQGPFAESLMGAWAQGQMLGSEVSSPPLRHHSSLFANVAPTLHINGTLRHRLYNATIML